MHFFFQNKKRLVLRFKDQNVPLRDVVVVIVMEVKCDGLDSRLSSSAVLPAEFNQPLLPTCGMPDWAPRLEPAPSSILVVCFYFPQCFPLASLRWFPAPCVEYLVLFRCPFVTFVGSLLAWYRCWGCFNLSPSRHLQAMNSQTSFPKLLLLYYFPLEMAEHLEIPGKWWLRPWRAALHRLCSQRNIPEHVAFAVCYEYICVLR